MCSTISEYIWKHGALSAFAPSSNPCFVTQAQVRSIASNLQTPVMARVHGQVRKTPFDVFTIDFRDEPSGLSGCLFEEQAVGIIPLPPPFFFLLNNFAFGNTCLAHQMPFYSVLLRITFPSVFDLLKRYMKMKICTCVSNFCLFSRSCWLSIHLGKWSLSTYDRIFCQD